MFNSPSLNLKPKVDGIKIFLWECFGKGDCPFCGAVMKTRGYRDGYLIIYCDRCGFEHLALEE